MNQRPYTSVGPIAQIIPRVSREFIRVSIFIALALTTALPAGAVSIDVNLIGFVTTVNDGGFAAVPPVSNDVAVGNAFSGHFVIDTDASFSFIDDFSSSGNFNFLEERRFWSRAVTQANFSVGTLNGFGDNGNPFGEGSFSYDFFETSDPSDAPVEHTDFSQTRDNTMRLDFASDGMSISNGQFVLTLENVGSPTPYIPCARSNIACLLAYSSWDTRRVLLTASQRGSVQVSVTGISVANVPLPAAFLPCAIALILLRTCSSIRGGGERI